MKVYGVNGYGYCDECLHEELPGSEEPCLECLSAFSASYGRDVNEIRTPHWTVKSDD